MKPNSTPEPASLRGYLARREDSRFELMRKLEAAGFSPEEIAPALDEFEEKDWLSDRRFAESWVADHRGRYGNIKLRFDLQQRGVDKNAIAEVMERITEDAS